MTFRETILRVWPGLAAALATLIGIGSCGYTSDLGLPAAPIVAIGIATVVFAALLSAARPRGSRNDRRVAIVRAAWIAWLTSVIVAFLVGAWVDGQFRESRATSDWTIRILGTMIGMMLGGIVAGAFFLIGRLIWLRPSEDRALVAEPPNEGDG